MPFIARSESLRRLRQSVADGKPIIGRGPAQGSRPSSVNGAGRYYYHLQLRPLSYGRPWQFGGMMPYGDANAIVVDMAWSGAAGSQKHTGLGRRLRHGSLSPHANLSARVKSFGL